MPLLVTCGIYSIAYVNILAPGEDEEESQKKKKKRPVYNRSHLQEVE
jgi:hypothetical protein